MKERPIYSSDSMQLYYADCIDIMRHYRDKHFDLAIVDPPYGIGQNWKKDRKAKFSDHANDFNNEVPNNTYFDELFRVSKNQIIFGCNYFWDKLPPSNNLIFWDKHNDPKKQFGSAGELAWTSYTKYPILKYDFIWTGFVRCEKTIRIHPHQKPIKLYQQCLNDFAEPGMTILDTHLGSGSSAIAAHKMGFNFVGIEKDEKYIMAAIERIKTETDQLNLKFEITEGI